MRKLHGTFLSFFALFLFLINTELSSAPLKFVPIKLTQPDGTILHVFASGDEFYNWVHDKDNYTILPNPRTGYYVYAEVSEGKLIPTDNIVGKVDPKSTGLKVGENVFPVKQIDNTKSVKRLSKLRAVSSTEVFPQPNSPVIGSRFNLVVFIRFKDEPEFSDAISKYDSLFNNPSGPSLKHFYKETSYNQLDITSYFYPQGSMIVSYQDINDRSYYKKYDAVNNPNGYTDDNRMTREYDLLKGALEFTKQQIPAGVNYDGDNDGFIDNVSFIISGGPEGWNELLWPHMTEYNYGDQSYNITINGKSVKNYNFHLQSSCDLATLAHETGHVLGLPDLYRYATTTGLNLPVFDDLWADNVKHIHSYLKWKYLGWIKTLPEIKQSGTYWINKSTAAARNIYAIKSSVSTQEFFILEYLNKEGLYDKDAMGSGLVVYRINNRENGNAGGPPDEIYIYRLYGSQTDDGIISSYHTYFGSDNGRPEFNDFTNPSSFLSDGLPGGLSIKNIGAVGDSIKFDVEIVKNLTDNNDYTVEKTTYNWIDISQTGTKITNWINGDIQGNNINALFDGYTSSAIPLGFDFTFYGQKFNSIFVGIDGLVSFSYQPLCYFPPGSLHGFYLSNMYWPENIYFPNSIAIAYADYCLYASYGGGKIMYKTIGDKFILSWLNAGKTLQNDTTNTFQLVLDKSDNSININYNNFGLDTTRKEIKVGIQKDQISGIGWINSGDDIERIPDNNTAVVFKSKAQYSITTNSNPPDGGKISGGGTFNMGQSSNVTLTTTANEGYQFLSWGEGNLVVSTIANYSFPATSSALFTANFKPLPLFTIEPAYIDVPSSEGSAQFKLIDKHGTFNLIKILNKKIDVDWVNCTTYSDAIILEEDWTLTYSANKGQARIGKLTITPDSIAGSPITVEIRQAGVTGVDDLKQSIPKTYSLANNFPNPFNPSTTINYSVPKTSFVTIKVYDVLGRTVAIIVKDIKPAGYYRVEFNAGKLASGIYFYRMESGSFTQTKKLLIMK